MTSNGGASVLTPGVTVCVAVSSLDMRSGGYDIVATPSEAMLSDTRDVPPLTYRELRNTPGLVAERLVEGRPIPLLLDGEIRGVIFPTSAEELGALQQLWARQRLWATARAMQVDSARRGTDSMTMDDIDDVVAEVRASEVRRETPSGEPIVGPLGETPPRRTGTRPRAQR